MLDEKGNPATQPMLGFTPLILGHRDMQTGIGDECPSSFTEQLRNEHARIADDKHRFF